MTTLISTQVSPQNIEILKTFQSALKAVVAVYHSGHSRDKRGQIKSINDYMKLRDDLKRFHNYPFMSPVLKQFAMIEKDIKTHSEAVDHVENSNIDIDATISKMKDIWKSGNREAILSIPNMIGSYVGSVDRTTKNPVDNRFNPFYIENPLIFQTSNFLRSFEKHDIEYVLNKNLDDNQFCYLPFSEIVETDFQYLAYFIMNMEPAATEHELNGSQLKQYFELAFGGSEYANLMSDISNYLHNNSKDLIPKILKAIQSFPKIMDIMEQRKKTINTLYRGFPYDPTYTNDYPMVATSASKSVAKRFALGIGHLESEDSRRYDEGVIVTYAPEPDDIILDLTIFGSIFGESEILIKSSTKIVNEEYV